MHHNDEDDSKVPDLPTIEMQYDATFKRVLRECYENHADQIHKFAYKRSDLDTENIDELNTDDPSQYDLEYSDYEGPAIVGREIGGEALYNIDEVGAKINKDLENIDPKDLHLALYLGKCALENGDAVNS